MKRSLFYLIAGVLVLGICLFSGLLLVDFPDREDAPSVQTASVESMDDMKKDGRGIIEKAIQKEAHASIKNNEKRFHALPVVDPPKYEIFNGNMPVEEEPGEPAKEPAAYGRPSWDGEEGKDGEYDPLNSEKSDDRPQIAIIIDDMGYDLGIAERFFELQADITYSILPHSPFLKEMVKLTAQKGYETLLHLPMEPLEYPRFDPGPGALLRSMTSEEIMDVFMDDLNGLSRIKGVNNHMGSSFTRDINGMRALFVVLKDHGLFFVNSKTATDTVCEIAAGEIQLPYAERDIFLDHIQSPDFVKRQIKLLIKKAHEKGSAVGIGHPHTVTLDALIQYLSIIKAGANIVPVSKLTGISG